MTSVTLDDWIKENHQRDGHWYVKRLSANDTQANGSHQAGPYVPNRVAFSLFPELNEPEILNHRVTFRLVSGSHSHATTANIIWYNNRLFGKTRNETRITGLGGATSPLLDPENTGAVALFFFCGSPNRRECRYWVCRDLNEEEVAETFAGAVEPARPIFWSTSVEFAGRLPIESEMQPCWLEADAVPDQWLAQFPSPREVFQTALSLRPYHGLPVDQRIVRRRECEYAVFKSVEYAVESNVIGKGFDTIDAFLARAQTILQRRKSRSGRSLELQLQRILQEENIDCTHQAVTESGNRPDFIFPSQSAYDDPNYPEDKLRMLAAKSSVKERWRQILEEAGRVSTKHLFTLQEGVSERQFWQMQDAMVQLVVPKSLHNKYPAAIRGNLMTLQDFVGELRDIAF